VSAFNEGVLTGVYFVGAIAFGRLARSTGGSWWRAMVIGTLWPIMAIGSAFYATRDSEGEPK